MDGQRRGLLRTGPARVLPRGGRHAEGGRERSKRGCRRRPDLDPDRRRPRDLQVPPLRARRDHPPHPRLRRRHGRTSRPLLRHRARACSRCSRPSPAAPTSPSPSRPSPSRRCSGRRADASNARSTAASTAASTTPSRTLEAFSGRLRQEVDLDTAARRSSCAVVDGDDAPAQGLALAQEPAMSTRAPAARLARLLLVVTVSADARRRRPRRAPRRSTARTSRPTLARLDPDILLRSRSSSSARS